MTTTSKPKRGQQSPARHPSGLTQERWDWPFKTEQERKKIADWLETKNFDTSRNPF